MTKKIYIEIDTDFVKPNSDCDACDTEYTCFECEHHQVKEKYPYSYYEGNGVWTKRTKKFLEEQNEKLQLITDYN